MFKIKEIVLKLATNEQSDKGFLLISTFVPKGLSVLALGLYTCINALKYIPGWTSRCQVSVYRTIGSLVGFDIWWPSLFQSAVVSRTSVV